MAIFNDKEVGALLKKIREKIKHKSIRSFALAAKIDASHYNKLENGDAPLSPGNLQKLIDAYGETPYAVFKGMRYGIDIPYYPELTNEGNSTVVDGQHRIYIDESPKKDEKFINNIEDPEIRRVVNKLASNDAKSLTAYINKINQDIFGLKKQIDIIQQVFGVERLESSLKILEATVQVNQRQLLHILEFLRLDTGTGKPLDEAEQEKRQMGK